MRIIWMATNRKTLESLNPKNIKYIDNIARSETLTQGKWSEKRKITFNLPTAKRRSVFAFHFRRSSVNFVSSPVC